MAENRFASDGASAPEAAADEPASPFTPSSATDALIDFDPVPLRYRRDGLTPDKQREYVEALADTGVAKAAAARIGVSEQAVARARRRPDARAFDRACEGALRFCARRVRSIAFERAIEGTIKRHYYHGELKSEERIFDNRLLIYLLGKLDSQLAPEPEADAVADNWDPWMEAIEQGLPAPPQPEPETARPPSPPFGVDEDGFDGSEVWQSGGEWWTDFPPPAGFDGIEEREPGAFGYKRTLSEAELAVIESQLAGEAQEKAALNPRTAARRDLFFGFEGGIEGEFFSPRGPETYETSGGSRP